MHRYLSRVALRWSPLSDSLVVPKAPERVQKNGTTERIEFSEPFVTRGYSHFPYEKQPSSWCTQLQIVNALRLGERERASNMLLNLVHGNSSLRAEDFAHILEYCARTPDPLFVMQTWTVMVEKTIDMNKRCWMFMIQALTNGGYLKEAFNWLTFLGENDCHHQCALPLYNIFLNGCAKSQSLVYADYCLKLMEGQFMGKSEITYLELLKVAVWQGNLSAVHEIWRDFIKYYSLGIRSLRKFIWAFTRLRDLESACRALRHMVALSMQGSSSLTVSAEKRYQCSKLDIPIPSINELQSERLTMGFEFSVPSALVGSSAKTKQGLEGNYGRENHSLYSTKEIVKLDSLITNPFHAPDTTDNSFLETLGNRSADEVEKVMVFLRWSFGDLIHACAHSRNCELAEQLFLQMHKLGLEPSRHIYDGFAKAVISEKGVTYAMKVVKEMEKRKLKPYNDTLAALSIGYSKNLELDLAESLLDQISDSSQKYIRPFNALLTSCDVMDQPERAVCILSKIKHLNIKPDIRTYEVLFSLFGNINAPYENGNILSHVDVTKRIRAIEIDMMRNGVQHSPISLENLMRALGAEGMIRELLHYLRVTENLFCQTMSCPGTAIYNTVLHALVEAGESYTATQIFRNMRSADFPPDAATYDIMIDCCSILRCFKSACALVSLMLRDGFSLETCTYTTLIKILLANEDFDGALSLLDQSKSEGIQPDVLLLNTILLEAYLKGHIDIIELILERMHQEKIKPDPTTCWYVFDAYRDRGFDSTAIEALQVLSMRMISEDDDILQEKRASFENLVHSEDPDVELRIIEVFKESDEHLAAALFNLRWCAIAGFSISWFPRESLWARRLSSHYGPGKGTA